jgi:hypothetical protein
MGKMLIVVAIFGAVAAMMLARGMSGGTNIEERRKYWEPLVAEGVKAGTTKQELEAFASRHGETLHCYMNGNRQDVCDFRDSQSKGGSRNLPMQLGAFFVMKGDKVVSHTLETATLRMQ